MPLKILLADDSMTAQRMGVKILVDAGHEVVAVSNGAAAVKKIASERPQLVVLDVYMPGYTGLEVCERMKAAPETAKTPVLLTVGKMEPFKPEEASRVKADGVLVKPFEASDLLAAVQKIEEKLSTAAVEAPPADYEKTVKLNVAEMFKQDSSYQEWQVAAPEHKDEEEQTQSGPLKVNTEVPAESAGDAVFGDMISDEAAPEAKAAALEAEPTPPQYATAPSVEITPVAPPIAEPAPIALETAPNTQKFEPPAGAHRDAEIEPTSGWGKDHAEPVEHAKDPALVTDPSEMASAFVTKFGVDNPEPITVGVASDANIPGLYTDSSTEAIAAEEEVPTQDVSAAAAKLQATEAEADSVEIIEEGEAEAAPATDDDFEKRVAAAMSGYEEPAAAPAPEPELAPTVMSKAPVIEPEPAPAPEPEPAPVAEAAAPVPEPEPAPVAVAAAAGAGGGWAAQEAPVAEHEATTSLDQEMLKAFTAALPEPEPQVAEPEHVVEAVATAPEPVAAAAPAPANVPDIELAKSLAAAVAPDAGPGTIRLAASEAAAAAGGSIDPAKLAEAIHRALDQLKPELISRIAKELEQNK